MHKEEEKYSKKIMKILRLIKKSADVIYEWPPRNLSHVAEEVVTSMTPSSEPIRELHSITDLSSDEKEDQFDIEISKV